ncbi:MAG TPA: alpha/beta hydrolase [Candidatus Acidoferrales bacterium]|nr:alpha/beta hydrolase [Candidatus Acidoferrales bacterium]
MRVGAVTLALRAEGSGPPLLLIHGFPTSGELWTGVAPRLVGAGFRVLVPDLLGYGASDAPAQGLDMASQADCTVELLDALAIPRVVVVAHDVGTAAALIIAAQAPNQVRGLALIDGVHEDRWAIEAIESIRGWDPADAARLAPLLSRTLREPGLSREALSGLLRPYEGSEGGSRLIRAARALDPTQTVGYAVRVRRAAIRSLVLWGDADRYLSLTEVGEPLARDLGAELKVVRGGHFLPLASPTLVAHEVVAFVRSLPR